MWKQPASRCKATTLSQAGSLIGSRIRTCSDLSLLFGSTNGSSLASGVVSAASACSRVFKTFLLVLCNRYDLPIAARSLGEFQEASEAPVSAAIPAEGATRKFAQRTAARRVELKMARRQRCSSFTCRKGHAHFSRLGGGPF